MLSDSLAGKGGATSNDDEEMPPLASPGNKPIVGTRTLTIILFLAMFSLNNIQSLSKNSVLNGAKLSSRMGVARFSIPPDYALPDWYPVASTTNNTLSLSRQVVVVVPSRQMPFIFFHQRKCGGNTLREQIRVAGEKHQLPFFIPCFQSEPCETYGTPPVNQGEKSPVLYGGHLYYASLLRTLALSHQSSANVKTTQKGRPTSQPQNPNFTCFTVFREPVSRIQSCWNYRFSQENRRKFPKLSSMNPDNTDIALLLTRSRSAFAEGCLNEPMRVFSDVGWNEEVVNNLDSVVRVGKEKHDTVSPDIAEWAVQQTIQRASQCVVGILERPEETQRLLRYYLPWLAEHVTFEERINSGLVSKGSLPNATVDAIRRVSHYEHHVYDVANQLMDAQLANIPSGA